MFYDDVKQPPRMLSFPALFTPTWRHDLYPAISPKEDLVGSAEGLSVLITGGGRGVGKGIALVFAMARAKKVVITSRTLTQLEEVEQAIEAEVGKGKVTVIKVVADITNREDVERLFEAAGELDVLVNNAGAGEKLARIHESDPDEWWNVQKLNVQGIYLSTRELLRRHLGRPELTILNVTSVGCATSRPGLSSYQGSKTQMNRLTEFIHFEYMDANVRVFAFHPGSVYTELAQHVIPEYAHNMLGDTAELAGGCALWLTTQGKKVDFLRGRYISANWDVAEILARKEEIVKKGLLFTRVLGQEQGTELQPGLW